MQPWTEEHNLHVLNQIEARPGEDGWIERRLTGKTIAVCSCGYSSGLVDRNALPPVENLAAQHPRCHA